MRSAEAILRLRALSGAALLVAAAAAILAETLGWPIAGPGSAALALLALMLLRVRGRSALRWIAGVVGPASAGGALFAGLAGLGLIEGRGYANEAFNLAAAILATGALIYPPALGLTRADPARLGYLGWPLDAALVAAAGIAAFLDVWSLAAWLPLAVVWRRLGLHPSRNLLDSLLDPVTMLAAAAYLAGTAALG
jgi:hypothetical protein